MTLLGGHEDERNTFEQIVAGDLTTIDQGGAKLSIYLSQRNVCLRCNR
jgi:hypothetical protein